MIYRQAVTSFLTKWDGNSTNHRFIQLGKRLMRLCKNVRYQIKGREEAGWILSQIISDNNL